MIILLFLSYISLINAQGTIKDGVQGTGTHFKKCGGGFFGGGDKRCFEVILKKFQVQMGSDGTNDDVSVKICSDIGKDCCTTPALSKSFSDDWSSNDLEQWGPDYFGKSCKGKKFSIERGLNVSLVKTGKDSLGVTSFYIEADGVTSPPGKNSPERFSCGRFSFTAPPAGSRNLTQAVTNLCSTSPYSYERVKQIKVAIGPDGTDDDVSATFCSDVNNVCCRTKLKTKLHDDWSKNDDEVWDESDLGSCKTVLYKVRDGIRFTLSKTGKDDLLVNKLTIVTENLKKSSFNYDCQGFNLASKGQVCREGVSCHQEKTCPKKLTSGTRGGTTKRTSERTTKRTTTTTRRSLSTTTKKAGLLDRIKGGLGFGGKKKTTTRRPTTTTRRTTTTTRPTTTKKAGLLDRIKGSLGFGSKSATTTTTTRHGLLSQGSGILRGSTTPSTTTTRRPFRG